MGRPWRPGVLQRGLLVAVSWVLVVTGAVAPAQADPRLPSEVEELLADRQAPPVRPVPWRESESAQPVASQPADPLPAAVFPKPGSWTVELRGGEPAAVVGGAEGPVKVVVPRERASGADVVGDRLAVEVLDPGRAKGLGVSGFLFRVTDTAGPTLAGAAKAGGLPAELVIDYSGFASAFGAGFADRLAVVAFAECGLTVPLPQGCRQPRTRLDTVNNASRRQLTAKVGDLAGLAAASTKDGGDAGVTFGVLAEPSGEEGSFAATDLSGTKQWQVAPGSGEFSYSYPIDVPKPGVGTAPSVGLGYSSGAVDGMTNGANTQASPVGVGWSLGTAFIERRYEPCAGTPGGTQTPDLCWMNHNGTISLEGVSGTLLPINGAADNHTEWVVHQDEGWRVQRLTGADNGVHQGEHWKVTAPDGTRYFFGLGRVAETGGVTSSALAVPVLAEHDTQPCWVAGRPIQACLNMGYRWMLDRVVDPDGNVTAYEYVKERNQYALLAGFGGTPWYDRAALLDKVAYGIREGVTGAATARVLVSTEWRCGALNPGCPEPTRDPEIARRFPDVPTDLICRNGTDCQWTPTFFTGKRYAHVQTQVRVGDTWRDGIRIIFGHGFKRDKLHLTQVGQVGLAQGGLLANPATVFDYTELRNRVDVNEDLGRKPMYHNRLATITNPFGGQTRVRYGQNRPCPQDYNPENWDTNDRDCFPQTMTHGGRHVGVFHKYLVTEVVEDPREGGAAMTTRYTYGEGDEDPAWAFNYGSFAQYDHAWGWSNWRGYGTTRITQGSSTTRVRVFRGWDGDPLMGDQGGGNQWPGGERRVTVRSFPESGSQPFVDHPALAGRVLEEQRIGTVSGVSSQVVSSTLYTYERRLTHPAPDRQLKNAEWAGVSSTTEYVATAPGQFRRRGGTTAYNAHFQPVTSKELGWLLVTGDERCTATTYAENPAANMFTYPASNRLVAGESCDTGAVLSASQTLYDGSTVVGALPGPGRPTRERTRIDQNTWAETVTEFDAFGRPVRVTDPNGATTTTTYRASPSHAIPTRTTVTNQLGHTSSTDWLPEFGVPLAETDVNGNTTRYAYDALGRTWKVWRPGHSTAGWPTWIFGYFPDRRVISSAQLTSPTNDGALAIEQAWTVYDGFWRERQNQAQSPVAGRVIASATNYDDRGLVRDRTAPQAVAGTPGEGLITGIAWDNRTRSQYDELGRLTAEQWLRGTTVAHQTTTAYGADTVTVTGPKGDRLRETVDGLGRTIEVAEHDGARWVATTKGYDLADRLTSVTDPAGNRTTYTYNLAGWQLTQTDPDRGSASFGYDRVGNQTRVTDGTGTSLHTRFDVLGRRVERRAGAPGGALQASWAYDTAPGGIGQLHRETTHTEHGQWISEVTGYDHRGRATATAVTVPAGVAGVAGTYTVTQTYDGADRVVRGTYPAIGGLPAETVTTTYDNLGHVTAVAGAESYVSRVKYDDRGRPHIADFGTRSGQPLWMYQIWSYNEDQMPSGTATWLRRADGTYGPVSEHRLAYDNAGNVADRVTSQNGLAWRECFTYDARNRLTGAHTVRADTTCAAGTPGSGDRPYVHGYRYSPDGNLLERTENGQTTRYSYPAPGSPRPHAPTQVGDVAYSWNGNGNLAERSASSPMQTVRGASATTETFRWDARNNLASVEGPAGATRFWYDSSGQRLLRQTGTTSTAYLLGHEITVDADGRVTDAVRGYGFGGQLIATRSVRGGVDYYVSGQAGSLEASVDSGQTAPAGTRAYEPYGQVRAKDGQGFATDRGFLGQTEDAGTGLSYLNARYYDTRTGQFMSPDPATRSDPYTYAAGNPASFADPSGLSPSYTLGLEIANRSLRLQNKQLRGHIRQLNGHISSLQKVIRQQNRAITKLLTHIDTLNSIIRQQQSIIRELENRVRYLISVVQQQQALINQLRATIAYQQRIIYAQAARIRQLEGQVAYYKGIVNQLAGRLWGHNPLYLNTVLLSIHSGNGIPAGAFSHDLISTLQTENTRLQATVEGLFDMSFDLQGRVASKQDRIDFMNDFMEQTSGDLLGTISSQAEQIASRERRIQNLENNVTLLNDILEGRYDHDWDEYNAERLAEPPETPMCEENVIATLICLYSGSRDLRGGIEGR